MSLLRVEGIGRLTADPEVKVVNIKGTDTTVANMTIAVDPEFGSNEAEFVRCVAWRKLAENAANHLSKGRLVYFDGRLKSNSYEKDGQKVYGYDVTLNSVQFLDKPKDNQSAPSGNNANYNVPF